MKNNSITTIVFVILRLTSLIMTTYPATAPSQPSQPETGSLPNGVVADATANVRAFLSFRPNPVGIGQSS
jgi:hypothetical protein